MNINLLVFACIYVWSSNPELVRLGWDHEQELEIYSICCSSKITHDKLRKIFEDPLHLAAVRGNLNVVRYCVETRKIDIDVVNMCGQTALMLAAKNNHYHVAEYLVEKGAQLELKEPSPSYKTALDFACLKGSVKIVNLLLKAGALVDAEGRSSLAQALHFGNTSIITKKLLNYNPRIVGRIMLGEINFCMPADDIICTIKNLSLFGVVAYTRHMALLSTALYEILDRINFGEKIYGAHELDKDGNNLLPYAAVNGKKNAVNVLLRKKVCLLHKNKDGNTTYGYLKRVLKRKDLSEYQRTNCTGILNDLHDLCLHYNRLLYRGVYFKYLPHDIKKEIKKYL